MYRPLVVACVCAALWITVGHCNTLILRPYNFDHLNSGNTYAWIIPPQLESLQEPLPLQRSASLPDLRNTQPLSSPAAGGCGHTTLIRRYSGEQLNLPNEFLIAPDTHSQRGAPPPVFQQQDTVNCIDPAIGQDCIQQQPTAAVQDQSNLAAVPATLNQLGAAHVNWPRQHAGGFGILFFIPESEQLIRQQLALHRTQLPFDISANCADPAGCFGGNGRMRITPPTTAALENPPSGGLLAENVNYASVPLVKNVNSSNNQQQDGQRDWRTIGELLAQQQQQQHQQELSMLA